MTQYKEKVWQLRLCFVAGLLCGMGSAFSGWAGMHFKEPKLFALTTLLGFLATLAAALLMRELSLPVGQRFQCPFKVGEWLTWSEFAVRPTDDWSRTSWRLIQTEAAGSKWRPAFQLELEHGDAKRSLLINPEGRFLQRPPTVYVVRVAPAPMPPTRSPRNQLTSLAARRTL